MKRIIPIVVTAFAFILTFGATAHAAAAIEPSGGTLLDLLTPAYEAFSQGHYLWAGATCLVLAVALARRYGTASMPWLASDAGAACLVLLGSFGAALSTSLAGGIAPTWAMVSVAFKIAFMAAGGYAVLKATVIVPYLTKLASKGPAWMHSPALLVLWVFQCAAPVAPAAPAAPAAPVAAPTTPAITPAQPASKEIP